MCMCMCKYAKSRPFEGEKKAQFFFAACTSRSILPVHVCAPCVSARTIVIQSGHVCARADGGEAGG